MANENIEEYMEHINIMNKEIAEYANEYTGVRYIIPTAHLLVRIEYMELTKEELAQKEFQQEVDKNVEYKTKMVKRPKSKYEITKNKKDMYTLVDSEVMVHQAWNVINGLKVKKSFNNKEEAIELYMKINKPIIDLIK